MLHKYKKNNMESYKMKQKLVTEETVAVNIIQLLGELLAYEIKQFLDYNCS